MKYYVKDLDKVIKKVQEDNTTALKKCWLYLEGQIKKQMNKDSKDTWELVRSITTKQVSDSQVIVWTNMEYAIVREYWRRPWKFPPPQALVWWTARKWMITWDKTARYEDLHYKDKWTIYVIARAIAKNWIEGKHTFENVINQQKDKIEALYIKLMNKW